MRTEPAAVKQGQASHSAHQGKRSTNPDATEGKLKPRAVTARDRNIGAAWTSRVRKNCEMCGGLGSVAAPAYGWVSPHGRGLAAEANG